MNNKPFPKGLNIKGLKCDACSYQNLNIEFKGLEDMENYIDAPCPVCGESLLTKEDFKLIKTLYIKFILMVQGSMVCT
jgi:C4-type Zn-finger protein